MSWSLLHHSATMAAARTGNSNLPNFTTATPIRKMPLRLICSISTPTPRKLTIRKNYLRQKLLKTLTKPYPNYLIFELTPTNPVIPIVLEPEQNHNFTSSEQFSGDSCPACIGEELAELAIEEFQAAEIQESVKLVDGSIGKVSKNSLFKYGLWLFGAFVFQTICAVWVLGSAENESEKGNGLNNEDKNGVLEVGLIGKGKSRGKFFLNAKMSLENGGVVYIDEDEMEKKIEEIRVMAREARERERMESKQDGYDSEDSDNEAEDEFGKSGIEKEVNDRLVKLRTRLENAREKLPVASVDYVRNDGVSEKNSLEGKESIGYMKKDDTGEKNSSGGKEGNAALMFKKKYRFRGLSGRPSDIPKGFKRLDDNSAGKEVNNNKDGGNTVLMNGDVGRDVVDMLDSVWDLDIQGSDSKAGMSMHLEGDRERKQALDTNKSSRTAGNELKKERDRRKQEKRVGLVKSESNGLTQDRNQGKPSIKAVKPRKSNIVKTNGLSNEHDVSNKNGNSKGIGIENNQSASKLGHEKPESETDCWWLNLPYVLVVHMRGGLDGVGTHGLFTLRSSPNKKNSLSHTVAFEDRGDATNFCYLLQSFFEDLEDFSAEVIPLSIKELNEAVKSHTMKVIVVKKGQLKLYAGQPLPDVEMALRSLVGQS